MSNSQLRKIVKREYWRSRSHPHSAKDSVTCHLECGHTVRYKGSKEPVSKARCRMCKNFLAEVEE